MWNHFGTANYELVATIYPLIYLVNRIIDINSLKLVIELFLIELIRDILRKTKKINVKPLLTKKKNWIEMNQYFLVVVQF